jgi:hypothetical protein
VLEDLTGRALTGDGQAVTIVGEPGMGSSVPSLPLVDLVRAQCGVGAAAGPDEITGLIEGQARELDLPADAASWLLRLVGIEGGAAAAATWTPEATKARTFEMLHLLFLRASTRQPLVIVVEDLPVARAEASARRAPAGG